MNSCCGRASVQVGAAKSEVHRLARLAARQAARGRSIEKILADLTIAKKHAAEAEENAADHECDKAARA